MKLKLLIIAVVFLLTSNISAQNGGYALKFNGTDGFASATINSGNTNSTTTLEMWFTQVTAQVGTQYLADLRSVAGSNKRRVMPYLNNGEIGISCAPNTGNDNNAITQATGVTVSTNVWYHIAVTINGSTLKMYVNGKLYITTSLTDTYSLTGAEVLTVATDYGNTTFANIKTDEVRVWSSERTEAEIKANMYKELAGSEAGLLAYYKMSNGSGAAVSDNQIAGSYGGTLSGGYTWIASGAFADNRNALDFDGTNDYVDCGNNASVQRNGTQPFTVEAWVKPVGGVWVAVVSKFVHTATNEGYSLEIFSDNRVSLLYGNSWSDWNAATSVEQITPGTWSHIAATYDGSMVKVYINGKLSTSSGWGSGLTDSGTNLLLGSRSGTTFYSGQMDEVRVWTVARTDAEIREGMCRTLIGNEAGLAAYYRLDQIDGSITYDLTSNANNGTLTNMDPATDWVTSAAFNTWIGAESSTWSTAGNWSKGAAPTSSNSVGLYKWNLGNEATITTTPTVNNLFVSSTASPTLNSSATINMNFILGKDFSLNGQNVSLGSTSFLVEGSYNLSGNTGTISTTRTLINISSLDVAGLGAKISTTSNMGSTTITRGHVVQTGNTNSSIKRYYDITPTNNSSLNATLVFNYKDSELNSLTETNFVLYKSTDAGTSWIDQGGTLSTGNNTLTKTGISGFSRWTVGDSSHPLGGPPDTTIAAAATGVTQTSFSANWSTATGATKYYMDVSTSNTFATFVTGYNNLDVGNVITYSVTGLTGGTTYYYRVRSYNPSGTSSNSNTITVVTTLTTPVATAATSITASSFSANWNSVTSVTGYYLDVATDIGFTSFVAGYNNKNVGNVTTYSIVSVSGGTTYYYRVRAHSAAYTSPNSNTITLLLNPMPPVALSATNIKETSFEVNWNITTGATKYYLDIATDAGFTNFIDGFNNKDVGNVTSVHVDNINSNEGYYYRVRAFNAAGISGNSNVILVNTIAEVPELTKLETGALNYIVKQSEITLTGLIEVHSSGASPIQTATVRITDNYSRNEDQLMLNGTENYTATWDSGSGTLTIIGSLDVAAYQEILRSVKYKNTSLTPTAGTRQISFTVNNGQVTSNSAVRSLIVSAANSAPVISNLEISILYYTKGVSGLHITLSDSLQVEDPDNYYLYGAEIKIKEGYKAEEDYIDFTNTASLTGSFDTVAGILTITGTETAAGYQSFLRNLTYRNQKASSAATSQKIIEYKVYDGILKSTAAARSLYVKSSVEAPSALTGTMISNKVELNWIDNATNEEGYIIERSDGNNSLYTEIGRVSGATTYSDLNIINGQRYYYRVAAYVGSAKSDYSNEVSVIGVVVGLTDFTTGLPKDFVMSQNYPNPFNPTTVIVFGLPYEAKVRIEVYNSLGQVVDILENSTKGPGYHKVSWNAGNMSSGVYLYRITAVSIDGRNQFAEVKRMVLMK
jgi:hypothetical protein